MPPPSTSRRTTRQDKYAASPKVRVKAVDRQPIVLPASLDHVGTPLLPDGAVPSPRGFGFGPDREVYLSSGIGPSGEGDNTIAVLSPDGTRIGPHLVHDPRCSRPTDGGFVPPVRAELTVLCPLPRGFRADSLGG